MHKHRTSFLSAGSKATVVTGVTVALCPGLQFDSEGRSQRAAAGLRAMGMQAAEPVCRSAVAVSATALATALPSKPQEVRAVPAKNTRAVPQASKHG